MSDLKQRRATVRENGEPQQTHRTVDRVTTILEEVVYHPGMTFTELVAAVGAAKSSVHNFIRGLLAKGWLYEEQSRFYLGPAVYGLTLASGHIRAGMVTDSDLAKLHEDTGVAVFLGVQAGDHLIYIGGVGSDFVAGFEARSNIRRTLLVTAGGKALLTARPEAERDAYLRRRTASEADLVTRFLQEYEEIKKTRIAHNIGIEGASSAIATTVHNRSGEAVAALTLLGPTTQIQPRIRKLSKLLLQHADALAQRSVVAREAI